jgi:DNA ligase-associated metallophosphoesterase
MASIFPIRVGDLELELLPEKAVWLPTEKVLLISDLHLGKAPHFRAHGIPLPDGAAKKDLAALATLIARWQPEKLLILGDFFHAEHNADWYLWEYFRLEFSYLTIELVMGNHDRLEQKWYAQAGMTCVAEKTIQGVWLVHEPMLDVKKPQISGHLHPGVLVKQKGRQHLRLPAFRLYQQHHLILPAFGSFTGLQIEKPPLKTTRHFATTGVQIFEIIPT